MRLVHSLLGVACVAALFACNRNNNPDRDSSNAEQTYGDKSGAPAPSPGERVGVTTVTGADLGLNLLANDIAIERIVAARCARETACNNVGADKHFVNHDLCVHAVRAKVGDDLRTAECPRGIDSDALDRCMDAIRTESCNNPIETIQRLAACRTSDMCLKLSERTR